MESFLVLVKILQLMSGVRQKKECFLVLVKVLLFPELEPLMNNESELEAW